MITHSDCGRRQLFDNRQCLAKLSRGGNRLRPLGLDPLAWVNLGLVGQNGRQVVHLAGDSPDSLQKVHGHPGVGLRPVNDVWINKFCNRLLSVRFPLMRQTWNRRHDSLPLFLRPTV